MLYFYFLLTDESLFGDHMLMWCPYPLLLFQVMTWMVPCE